MAVNIETAIANMYALKSRGIRYSMTGSRTGSDGTGDCSGTIYDSLRKGGMPNAGWILNTDSMHDWLAKNGWELIAQNKSWTMKRGDVVILGPKGASGGAAGHVFMAVDGTNAIHCTYKSATANGVYVENEANMPYSMGFYVYRLKGSSTSTPTNTITNTQDYANGTKVKLKSSATHYQTGQAIPSNVKNKTYTVMQKKLVNKSISKYAFLLKEIMSWVYAQDLEAADNKPATTNTNKKRGSVMLLFKESGKIYWLVGNNYSYVENPNDLSQIKTLMKQAGYDTHEHTNATQIKYIKKLAKKV